MKRRRYISIVLLLFVIPLGFSTKFYHGVYESWVHNYAGDIFYPMFWMYLILLVFPQLSVCWTGIIVFVFSTAIELSQLSSWSVLEYFRQSFLGRTIFGVSFSWTDVRYYAIGCFFGCSLWKLLNNFFLSSSEEKTEG